jgi:translocator protein
MEGAHHVRELRKGPLLAAVALPVLFAVFGTALVGGSGLEWFAGLAKPRFLVPLRVFYLVGALYYVLAAVVLYRILARIDAPQGRAISFGLTVGVLLLNELWNYGFFGLRSTLAGFLGMVVFLALLTSLIVALCPSSVSKRKRCSSCASAASRADGTPARAGLRTSPRSSLTPARRSGASPSTRSPR